MANYNRELSKTKDCRFKTRLRLVDLLLKWR